MTLNEIKEAVLASKTVCWSHDGYEVHYWGDGNMLEPQRWSIVCLANRHSIGLTWLDGVTMNGKPDEFYVKEAA